MSLLGSDYHRGSQWFCLFDWLGLLHACMKDAWSIDNLIRDFLRMCLLVRFDLRLVWFFALIMTSCAWLAWGFIKINSHFWLVNSLTWTDFLTLDLLWSWLCVRDWPILIQKVIRQWGIRALSINLFDLIVPTHYRCLAAV